MKVTDPQYYTYIGYKISDAENTNSGQTLVPGDPNFTVGAQTEKWITLYVEPRANGTAHYAKDTVDNDLGHVHLPVAPAMSLSVSQGIGYIANKSTIRVPSQNTVQTLVVTAEAWGDGIAGDNMNLTRVSGPTWGTLPLGDSKTLSIPIPSGNTSGSMKVRAESPDNPALGMEFTIQVIDLIVMHTDSNTEMTPNYTLYVVSSPTQPTVLNFSASKAVDWRIRSQTGVRAALSSANGTANILTIPANYRGTINIRVTSGTLIRNFRVVVRR
jgi:hypothetical protein